jgi:hypothetical protein
MTDEIRVGSRVRCGVYVLGEWVPMHVGIVTRDHGDGSYDVDRMSLHGGAAWVHRERNVRLEPAGVAPSDASLAEGFDGSTVRPGANHSTIEIWYDTEEQARAAHKVIRALIDASGVTPTVPARPRGVHALAAVVSNLLQTGRYSDEEGEATAELLDLLKSLTDGALVPATPTQAMLDAADKVLDSDPRHIAEAWRAMVAAAGVGVPRHETFSQDTRTGSQEDK